MEHSPVTGAAVKRLLLIANCLILTVGGCGGPLVKRLYFVRGGRRIWFSSWLETSGCPVILILLLVNYARRRGGSAAPPTLFLMEPRVFLAAAAIGARTGLDSYLYAYGVAKLPVSTSSLILATQMAFTAAFAFVVVKQRLKAASINVVVLLTVGEVVLGIHSSGDKQAGEPSREYLLGFETPLC